MAEKTTQEIFDTREKYRREIRGRMITAYNNGDVEKFRAFQGILEGDLQYEFQELRNNKRYTKALTNSYFRAHGEQFNGNITDLIEKDFEHWNLIDGSLLVAGKGVYDAYAEMDEETKKNNSIRWQTYINTSPTGDYSRDFKEQFKGVAKGVGIDVGASLGIGTAANIAKSTLAKNTARGVLTNALSSKTKVVGTGALYGMTADVERQHMEMGLGLRDEYDIGQTAQSAVIGGGAGLAGKPIGWAAGKAGRASTHMLQGASTLAQKLSGGYSATAAARGITREAGEVTGKYGADKDVGALNFQGNLQSGLQKTHQYYNDAFDAIPLNNINPVGVLNVFQRWKKTVGVEVPKEAVQTMEKLAAKTITPIEALRELKSVLYHTANPSKMAGKKPVSDSTRQTLYAFRKELTDMEEIAAYNQGHGKQYKLLKDNYGAFQNLLKTKVGKKILLASESPEEAGKLIKGMVLGDFSWHHLRSFQKALNSSAFKGTGQEQTAINLHQNIQKAVGGFLRGQNGDYKNLVTLINDKQGLKTLKTIYPEDKAFWTSLMNLSRKLPEKKGGSSSVVMNMAIARVGSNIGTDLTKGAASQQLRQAGPIVGALSGISVVNKLVDAPFFQNAMIKAYQRKGGTLDTGTKAWLKQKGYSRTEIESIQNTLWGMTGTGYAMGSLDEIWEKYEDPVKRKIEEVKAGYIW